MKLKLTLLVAVACFMPMGCPRAMTPLELSGKNFDTATRAYEVSAKALVRLRDAEVLDDAQWADVQEIDRNVHAGFREWREYLRIGEPFPAKDALNALLDRLTVYLLKERE